MILYDQWVKEEYKKECIAKRITDVLLQEIVSNNFKNSLIEIIAWLIDTAMYCLSIEYEIKVTRAKW